MLSTTSLLLLALALGSQDVLGSPVAAKSPTATIDSGVVMGIQTSLPSSSVLVNEFFAIPYAAPPVRFSPAVKPKPWTSAYQATKKGPSCIQQYDYPEGFRNFTMAGFNVPAPVESEDCLHLNVYAPAAQSKDSSGLRPVMFYIHGGVFEFGNNAQPIFDGTSFASNQDIILVVANYRLNVFGFPMAPQLPLTQRNLGLLDQRMALDWVQRNIKAFGGDPTRVTIFGESAGAGAVDLLLTTTPKNPPFRAAIMESGQASFYVNPTNSPASWETLISKLNCNTTDALACARAAPASLLKSIAEVNTIAFRPVSDNITCMRLPEAARKAGNIAPVPIMTGTNMNEGTITTLGQTDLTAFLNANFPGQTSLQNAIVQAYPIGAPGITDVVSQIATIYTDYTFHCPSSFLANHSVTHFPTWRYLYNSTFPNIQVVPGYNEGVYHTSELSMVFGTYDIYPGNGGPTTDEKVLSALMQKAWGDFAKNPTAGPGWQQVPAVVVVGGPGGKSEAKGAYVTLSSAGALDARCELFRALYDAYEG